MTLGNSFLPACPPGKGPGVRVQQGLTLHPYLADRHHGTPMLLDGVKCVGAELEYDSEHSDWHGFD